MTLGETPLSLPLVHNQQSSLSPAFGVMSSKLPTAGQGKEWHSLCYTVLRLEETKQTDNQMSTSAQNVEYATRASAEPRIWALIHRKDSFQKEGRLPYGKLSIRLRNLYNAEVQVLSESQAEFSLHPKIVNVNTKTSLLLHRTLHHAPWLNQDQVMSFN